MQETRAEEGGSGGTALATAAARPAMLLRRDAAAEWAVLRAGEQTPEVGRSAAWPSSWRTVCCASARLRVPSTAPSMATC